MSRPERVEFGKKKPDVKELCDLMSLRGKELVDKIEQTYGNNAKLCDRLNTSEKRGLSGEPEEIEHRRRIFGTNELTPKKPKSFLRLVCDAAMDWTMGCLFVAALISLALSTYRPPKAHKSNGANDSESEAGWIEGSGIMISVVIVILVTAFNDYSKDRQFRSLQERVKHDQVISVIRNGMIVEVPIHQLVVGDIVQIGYGDILPADGIMLQGDELKVDESSMTGESDQVVKSVNNDPALFSGTQIMEGSGRMVLTAVGIHSRVGMMFVMLGAVKLNKETSQKFNGVDKKIMQQENYTKKTDVDIEKGESSKSTNIEVGFDVIRASTSTKVVHFEQGETLELQNLITKKESPNIEIRPTHTKSIKDKKKIFDEEEDDEDPRQRPSRKMKSILDAKLVHLAARIGKYGMLAGLLIISILILRSLAINFFIDEKSLDWNYLQYIVKYIITGITVIVVAVPEGLPLAITLALAYSVKKMMLDNNLVRHMNACETMGNATTICSDKTGTLTMNRMTAVQLYFCGERTSPNKLFKDLADTMVSILYEAVVYNCARTSKVVPSETIGEPPKQIGNKTECALLTMVDNMGGNHQNLRINLEANESKIEKVYTFNSQRKMMTTVMRLPDNKSYRVMTKGAAELVLDKCDFICQNKQLVDKLSLEEKERLIDEVINPMASSGLRTICIAYKDYVLDEKNCVNEVMYTVKTDWDDEEEVTNGLTCLCVVGIEDPVRPEVPNAIRQCQEAGITVRMVTGDNLNTASCIATQCGIYHVNEDHLILEGADFNQMIRDETTGDVDQMKFDQVWPRLRVLARSSPQDKSTLVKHIIASKVNKNREVVAVTGDGTNDGPALQMADVGFAMGISGTDVAKEAADIIITDDNFSSIVKAVMWGRNVYDNVAKFLQFQLTVNAVAVSIAFFGALFYDESPLKAVQMLWVNLIMDTLASLALATEMPTPALLNRKPYGRNKALISRKMYKFILGHGAYQFFVLMLLLNFNTSILGIKSGLNLPLTAPPSVHLTIVFNTFVMMTLVNEINARKVHNEVNVFDGFFANPIFVGIISITVVGQFLIVQYGGRPFSTTPLNFCQWAVCITFGLGEIPWGIFLSLMISKSTVPKAWRWGKQTPEQFIGKRAADQDETMYPVASAKSNPSLKSEIEEAFYRGMPRRLPSWTEAWSLRRRYGLTRSNTWPTELRW